MSIFKNTNWAYVNPTDTTRMYILFKDKIKLDKALEIDNWSDILQYIIIKYEDTSTDPVDIKIELLEEPIRLDEISHNNLPFDLNKTLFYKLMEYPRKCLIYVNSKEDSPIDTKLIDIELYNLLDLQMNAIITNVEQNKPWQEGLRELGYNKPLSNYTRNFKLYHYDGVEAKLYKEIADYLGFKHDTAFISILDKQVYTIDNLDPEIDLDAFLHEGHIVKPANVIGGKKQADKTSTEESVYEDKWSEIIPRKKEELVHFSLRLNSYNGQSIDNVMEHEMYKVYDGNINTNMTTNGVKNILLAMIKEDLKQKRQSDNFINIVMDKVSSLVDTIIKKTLDRKKLYNTRIESFNHVREELGEYLTLVGNIYLDLLYYIIYTEGNTSYIQDYYNKHKKIFKYFTHGDVITSLDRLYSGKQYTMSLVLEEGEIDFNTKPQSISLMASYNRLFDDVSNRIAEKVNKA